ncbi:MAG: hypothetical protein AAGA41_14135 [Pseudomonadota bacterium]
MTERIDAMPIGAFLQRTVHVALDTALLIFAALIGFLMYFGINALQSPITFVPGVLVLVYTTSALTKYATLITRAVALGYDVPAADNAVFDYFRNLWAFTPWLALCALGGLGWVINMGLGAVALAVYLLLVLPVLPAIIAVISVNASLLTLIRVGELTRFIRILGLDYLKILGSWFVILSLDVVLPISGYLSVLLFCLQILWLFSSTGVVLYHHYLPLGIPVERLPADERQQQRDDAALNRERQSALDEAYGYFSRGNEVGGLQRLRGYLSAHDDYDAWAWFLDRMRGWESPRPFVLVAQNQFPRLLEAGDRGAALSLLVECMQRDADFSPRPENRASLRELLEGHPFAERAARWR